MKRLLLTLMAFLFLLVLTNNVSWAQEAKKEDKKPEEKQAEKAPPESKPALGAGKEAALKVRKEPCTCLDTKDFSTTAIVVNSFKRVEEDEWDEAIAALTASINLIKEHGKKCKCPEVVTYQQIIEAFKDYAEGGKHLDNVDKPDCVFAEGKYTKCIKTLTESLKKIEDENLKKIVNEVLSWAKEENDFVKTECTKN